MLGKACDVVISEEELNVGAERAKARLTQCLVPSCIPLMPTTKSENCPGDATATQLLSIFLVGCKTLEKVVSSRLLHLKALTKTAAVRARKLPVLTDEKVKGTFLRACSIF